MRVPWSVGGIRPKQFIPQSFYIPSIPQNSKFMMTIELVEYATPAFRCLLPAGGKIKEPFPGLYSAYPGDDFLRAVLISRRAPGEGEARAYLIDKDKELHAGEVEDMPGVAERRYWTWPDAMGWRLDGKVKVYVWQFRFETGGWGFSIAVFGSQEIYDHGEAWKRMLASVAYDHGAFLRQRKDGDERYSASRRNMSHAFAEINFTPYSRYGLTCAYPSALSVKHDLPMFWLTRKGKYRQTVNASLCAQQTLEEIIAAQKDGQQRMQQYEDNYVTRRVLRFGDMEDMPGWHEYVTECMNKETRKTFTDWGCYAHFGGELFHISIMDELDFAVTEAVWRRFLQSFSYDPSAKAATPSASVRELKRPRIPRGEKLTPSGGQGLERRLRAAARAAEADSAQWNDPDPDPEDWKFTLRGWPWPDGKAEHMREEFARDHDLPARVDLAFSPKGPATFVLMPPGRFVMGGWLGITAQGGLRPYSAGSGKGPGKARDVGAVCPVRIGKIERPFYIMSTPVTQEMWQSIMDANPSLFQGDADSPLRPVETVSFRDVVDAFIPAAMERFLAGTGLALRLADETEWEYTYRAGTATAFYSGQISVKKAYYSGAGAVAAVLSTGPVINTATSPVARYPANPWGLYDMAGNVFEWCRNEFSVYQAEEEKKGNGDARIIRGGSYDSADVDCCSFAYRPHPAARPESTISFRLVLSLDD